MALSRSAPGGAKDPYWLTATRKAFRLLLKREWTDEACGTSRSKRGREDWEQSLHFSEDEAQTNGDLPPAVPEIGKIFRLPWMPRHPIVPELIAVACIARALGSRDAVMRLFEPAQFTHVVMPTLEEEVGDVADTVETSLTLWSGRVGYEVDDRGRLKMLTSFEVPEASQRISQTIKQLRSKIETSLRAGQPVVLITPTEELHGPLRRHVSSKLICPRLTPDVVIEIIRVLHRRASRLDDRDLRARLPAPDDLARLTGTQLQAALRSTEPERVFSRLHQQASLPISAQRLTLDRVHGQKAAIEKLTRMLKNFRAWQAGKITWAEANMSAVFFGPPGNGKTMLAEAFAGSSGIPLHVTSYAECQKFGHQGDMLKALHEAFRAAEMSAPSVLFIDEIDSFSDRSRESQSEQYMRGVVNGFLTHLSRAATTPGLVLLAATNNLSIVDPAVIRPGRFDLKIPIGNPDREGICRILADHLFPIGTSELTDTDLDGISAEFVGASGAEVAAKAREALSRARVEERPVTLADLVAVLEQQSSKLHAEHMRRQAVHEAGHVIVRAVSSLPSPCSVRIGAGSAVVENHGLPFLTPKTGEEHLCEMLGGRVAERLVLGSVSSGAGHGPDSDLAQATLLALRMQSEWCLYSESLVWQPVASLLPLGIPRELKAAVEAQLRAAEDSAEKTLRQHEAALRQLTDLLLEKRELAGEDLQAVLNDLGLRRPEPQESDQLTAK